MGEGGGGRAGGIRRVAPVVYDDQFYDSAYASDSDAKENRPLRPEKAGTGYGLLPEMNYSLAGEFIKVRRKFSKNMLAREIRRYSSPSG